MIDIKIFSESTDRKAFSSSGYMSNVQRALQIPCKRKQEQSNGEKKESEYTKDINARPVKRLCACFEAKVGSASGKATQVIPNLKGKTTLPSKPRKGIKRKDSHNESEEENLDQSRTKKLKAALPDSTVACDKLQVSSKPEKAASQKKLSRTSKNDACEDLSVHVARPTPAESTSYHQPTNQNANFSISLDELVSFLFTKVDTEYDLLTASATVNFTESHTNGLNTSDESNALHDEITPAAADQSDDLNASLLIKDDTCGSDCSLNSPATADFPEHHNHDFKPTDESDSSLQIENFPLTDNFFDKLNTLLSSKPDTSSKVPNAIDSTEIRDFEQGHTGNSDSSLQNKEVPAAAIYLGELFNFLLGGAANTAIFTAKSNEIKPFTTFSSFSQATSDEIKPNSPSSIKEYDDGVDASSSTGGGREKKPSESSTTTKKKVTKKSKTLHDIDGDTSSSTQSDPAQEHQVKRRRDFTDVPLSRKFSSFPSYTGKPQSSKGGRNGISRSNRISSDTSVRDRVNFFENLNSQITGKFKATLADRLKSPSSKGKERATKADFEEWQAKADEEFLLERKLNEDKYLKLPDHAILLRERSTAIGSLSGSSSSSSQISDTDTSKILSIGTSSSSSSSTSGKRISKKAAGPDPIKVLVKLGNFSLRNSNKPPVDVTQAPKPATEDKLIFEPSAKHKEIKAKRRRIHSRLNRYARIRTRYGMPNNRPEPPNWGSPSTEEENTAKTPTAFERALKKLRKARDKNSVKKSK